MNPLCRALALLLLSGCAAPSAYWVKAHEPVAHTKTITVAAPCGRADWLACNSRYTGVIQLHRGLNEAQRWCALNHELKHLAGYVHPNLNTGFASDCGNGEML